MRLQLFIPLLLGTLFGQSITPIADIQYVADPATSDASPLIGQTVTVSGVVAAEFWGSPGNCYMVIQDADSAWCGIVAYEAGGWDNFEMTFAEHFWRAHLVYGDSVTLTATVEEHNNLTRLTSTSAFAVHDRAAKPAPIEVSILEANAEKYEGVLIRVSDIDVSDPDMGDGEWSVTDGSSDLVIGNIWDYFYYRKVGDSLATVTGILDYSAGAYKLQPRSAYDVDEAGPFTRIQRIQHRELSRLFGNPNGTAYDYSALAGDTVSCIGIVTVPTSELSVINTSVTPWTGSMRFFLQDPNGGPYSSLLAYFPDPTAFPNLIEGDSVLMTGYIDEWGWPAQTTEIIITEPITILGWDAHAHIPERPVISTGDLRLSITAEQWENTIVRIEHATVIEDILPWGEFSIDDGSGSINADADYTNSMRGVDVYGDLIAVPFVPPPNGTSVESIEGIVYHRYGSYDDSTTYKVCPVYPSDVVLGAVSSIGDGNDLPLQFSLAQNYPNPFNPITTIEYSLARPAQHNLKVYNLRGALVATLVDDVRPAGKYTVHWNANSLASGIYFLRLNAEDFHQTRKLVMLK
jgi:hypothetical protein